MLNYLFRRLGGAIPTLFIIIAGTFFMMRLAPGGPFARERKVPPEVEANLLKAYHLDEPLWHAVPALSERPRSTAISGRPSNTRTSPSPS